MHKWTVGYNEGGVENVAWFDEHTGEYIVGDAQSGVVNQNIIDENALWRSTERGDRHNHAPGAAEGRKIASIPITIWHSWRKEWMENHHNEWTWQTYELMKLADPDNAAFLTTNKAIPTHGPRDRPQMV